MSMSGQHVVDPNYQPQYAVQGQQPQQQQYGTVYNQEKTVQPPYSQPGSPAPYQQDRIQQMQHQQLAPPPPVVQPDRVLTQPLKNPEVVYRGGTITYEPRLSKKDLFHEGLCGCFGDFFSCKNMNTCCCGMWCPCVLYSRIHYRLRTRNPEDINGFSSCNSQCWAMCCCASWLFSWRQRDELRHKYQLDGSCCGDCMRHACCLNCALCQEEKELLYRERELADLVRHNNTYQPMQRMSMAPGQ